MLSPSNALLTTLVNEEWCKNTEYNWNSSLPMRIRSKYNFLVIDDSFLSQ